MPEYIVVRVQTSVYRIEAANSREAERKILFRERAILLRCDDTLLATPVEGEELVHINTDGSFSEPFHRSGKEQESQGQAI